MTVGIIQLSDAAGSILENMPHIRPARRLRVPDDGTDAYIGMVQGEDAVGQG